jgi:hypothetical protein
METQQIVNAGATTSWSETPTITPVNYQNLNRANPSPTIDAHSAGSELSCASYYSTFQENYAD